MSKLLPFTVMFMTGCNGAAFWGNLVVLGMTVGVFCATLALGRSTPATRSGLSTSGLTGAADASSTK